MYDPNYHLTSAVALKWVCVRYRLHGSSKVWVERTLLITAGVRICTPVSAAWEAKHRLSIASYLCSSLHILKCLTPTPWACAWEVGHVASFLEQAVSGFVGHWVELPLCVLSWHLCWDEPWVICCAGRPGCSKPTKSVKLTSFLAYTQNFRKWLEDLGVQPSKLQAYYWMIMSLDNVSGTRTSKSWQGRDGPGDRCNSREVGQGNWDLLVPSGSWQ